MKNRNSVMNFIWVGIRSENFFSDSSNHSNVTVNANVWRIPSFAGGIV